MPINILSSLFRWLNSGLMIQPISDGDGGLPEIMIARTVIEPEESAAEKIYATLRECREQVRFIHAFKIFFLIRKCFFEIKKYIKYFKRLIQKSREE